MSFLGVSALCGILAAGLIFPLAATGGAAAAAGSDILDEIPAELEEAPLSTPSVMLDSEGNQIAEFYEENREPVALDEVSQTMQDAILAIEDERFYEHGGVDARGVGRAMAHNLTRPTQQGASTITQQYVNNVLNNAVTITGEGQYTISGINEKTYGDKLREMKLAVAVEQEMTKEEILEGYLNIVLLGGRNYGVEAAAQSYWGIPASELNVAQSAVLAGMVQSPTPTTRAPTLTPRCTGGTPSSTPWSATGSSPQTRPKRRGTRIWTSSRTPERALTASTPPAPRTSATT